MKERLPRLVDGSAVFLGSFVSGMLYAAHGNGRQRVGQEKARHCEAESCVGRVREIGKQGASWAGEKWLGRLFRSDNDEYIQVRDKFR